MINEYKWRCPRCGMKFVERNTQVGNIGKCATPKCPVKHSMGGTSNKFSHPLSVRPGETQGLERITNG